jgi:hypothetical protein
MISRSCTWSLQNPPTQGVENADIDAARFAFSVPLREHTIATSCASAWRTRVGRHANSEKGHKRTISGFPNGRHTP